MTTIMLTREQHDAVFVDQRVEFFEWVMEQNIRPPKIFYIDGRVVQLVFPDEEQATVFKLRWV